MVDQTAAYEGFRRLAIDYNSDAAREERHSEKVLAAEAAAQAPAPEPREFPRRIIVEDDKRFVIENRDGEDFLLGQEGGQLGVGFKISPETMKASLAEGTEVDDGTSPVGKFLGDLNIGLASPTAGFTQGLVKAGAEGLAALGVLEQKTVDDYFKMVDEIEDTATGTGTVSEALAGTGEVTGQLAAPAMAMFKVLKSAGMAPFAAATISELAAGFLAMSPNDPNLFNITLPETVDNKALQTLRDFLVTDPEKSGLENRVANATEALTILTGSVAVATAIGKAMTASKGFLDKFDEGMAAKGDEILALPAPDERLALPAPGEKLALAPPGLSARTTNKEREWWKELLDNDANRAELLEEIPSFRMDPDGKVSIAKEDVDNLVEFIDGSIVADGAGSVPPRLRSGRFVDMLEDDLGTMVFTGDLLQDTLKIGEGKPSTAGEMQAATISEFPKDITAPGAGVPKVFTQPYKVPPTSHGLQEAFSRGIDKYNSLDAAGKIEMAQWADEVIAKFIGKYPSKTGHQKLVTKNMKLVKTEEGFEGGKPVEMPDGRNIDNIGLALAPAFKVGKFTTCPNSKSCAGVCLGKTSGGYFFMGGGADLSAMKGPRLESLKKTLAMIHEPEAFAVKLNREITDAKVKAAKNGRVLAMRLNVLSDINPKLHEAIIKSHPDVSFYDYTKNNTSPIAPNHHYTYSSTGVSQTVNGKAINNPHSNWKQMRKRLDDGFNVAVAFSNKTAMPRTVVDEETGKTYRVVNGDEHDYRPLDATPNGDDGVITGLKNKDKSKPGDTAPANSGGFFVHYDPKFKRTGSKLDRDADGNPIPQNYEVRIAKQPRNPKTLDNDGKAQGK